LRGPWRWVRRYRGGRPPKPRLLGLKPPIGLVFIPYKGGIPSPKPPVRIAPDEYEAFRLVYYENLSQDEAASRMGVSRGTLWRLLRNARRKIAMALVEARPLEISSS